VAPRAPYACIALVAFVGESGAPGNKALMQLEEEIAAKA
jgi:hypothetical protein